MELPFAILLGYVAVVLVFFALLGFSVSWTRWKARRLLRDSLGRRLRRGEETSLKAWMIAQGPEVDTAGRYLEQNPFDRILKPLEDSTGISDSSRIRFLDPDASPDPLDSDAPPDPTELEAFRTIIGRRRVLCGWG